MKNVLFYVLVLISLLLFSVGFCIIGSERDEDVLVGSLFIGVAVFITFILWKNNFFNKNSK